MSNEYLIHAHPNHEFEVEADLQAWGLQAWVPRALKSKRVKDLARSTVWYDAPYLDTSGYMLAVIPAIYFADVANHKHVTHKPQALNALDVKQFGIFRARVEAEYAEQARIRDNGEASCGFERGQALEILRGSFEGHSLVFKDMVQRTGDLYPRVRGKLKVLGGDVPIELDPLDVKVAE